MVPQAVHPASVQTNHRAPHLSAGILAITVSTVPLFTYSIMLLLRFESIVMRRMAGILLGSGFAYLMFFYTIKTSGPVFASQCAYAVTISGVIWGIIVFSEQHSIWVWISVMVMLLGLALVSPDQEAEIEDGSSTTTAESSC